MVDGWSGQDKKGASESARHWAHIIDAIRLARAKGYKKMKLEGMLEPSEDNCALCGIHLTIKNGTIKICGSCPLIKLGMGCHEYRSPYREFLDCVDAPKALLFIDIGKYDDAIKKATRMHDILTYIGMGESIEEIKKKVRSK